MKRTILIVLSAIAVMMSGCNRADTMLGVNDMVIVNYTVTNLETKVTLGDASEVNYVWYALYRPDGSLVKDFGTSFFYEGKAYCPVTMVRDQDYKVVFVAQHYEVIGETKTPAYAIDPQSAVLTMPIAAVANSDNYDVFTYVDEVDDFQGGNAKSVTLDRCVAQVNYFCTADDWTNASSLDMTPTESEIMLEGVPASYDVLSGSPSTQTITVTYAKAPLTGDANLLGTAYCLAEDNLTKATLSLYKGDEATGTLEVIGLPVEPNYRTNITGSIMTGTLNYTITLNTESEAVEHPLHD